jgi:AMP nucleosidase
MHRFADKAVQDGILDIFAIGLNGRSISSNFRSCPLLTPPFIAPARFSDPAAALEQLRAIYDANVGHLRDCLQRFVQGETLSGRVRACYPFVRLHTDTVARADSRLSYGFVAGPGTYETTVTRPDLFGGYYLEQLRLLLKNHGLNQSVQLEVGTSTQPIPVHFSFREHDHIEGFMTAERRLAMRDLFDLPDLAAMDDGIANGTYEAAAGEAQPLSLFTAPRVDYSLHRLRHYTGTEAEHFQNYVLFTNYQFYIDEFVRLGHEIMRRPMDPQAPEHEDHYIAFVEPGNVITRRVGQNVQPGDDLGSPPPRLPQMPGYHLIRADGSGITMVNIGVGPANAKTITDHIAVLRPHAWMMLGHCAGLRNSQQLGDYVLAHGYVREDHVLDEDLPLWVPIPALAEIQVALETAVAEVTQLTGFELKRIMRTGTVASTDNRNWELLPHRTPERRFSQSRAIALDMESATIAANGFRFRVPYGTLLCVSDKPLHGEIKLPGMANHFYRERVDQHLRIGIRAVELLRKEGVDKLHSRKLRSFAEVAFQ